MGTRGPQAEPTALKILKGNPGKRPINQSEPTPASGIPQMPEHFSDIEKQLWQVFTAELAGVPGLLTVIDGHALEKLVSLEADWLENDARLKESGHLYEDRSGKITKSPRLAIKQELTEQCLILYREMGLTASARSRLHVAAAPPPAKSPWANLRTTSSVV